MSQNFANVFTCNDADNCNKRIPDYCSTITSGGVAVAGGVGAKLGAATVPGVGAGGSAASALTKSVASRVVVSLRLLGVLLLTCALSVSV
jgi:hypothetical protein